MNIFCIEGTRTGRGPYGMGGPGIFAQYKTDGEDAAHLHHPTPYTDLGLQDWANSNLWVGEYFCGFESMDQLERWFPRERWHYFRDYNLEEIQEAESGEYEANQLQIVRYEAHLHDVEIGLNQVLFRKDEAWGRTVIDDFTRVMIHNK